MLQVPEKDEINRVLHYLAHPEHLVVKLLYGCGLRLGECMSLRINNFNFDQRILTIHDGKGKKASLIFNVIAPLGRLQAGCEGNPLKIKAIF